MRFELATSEDDPCLRRLVKETPVPGWVELTYQREPSYFAADSGRQSQVIVGRNPSGTAVAVASHTRYRVWLEGEPTTISYLSGLRVHPRYQGQLAAARGFRFLKQLRPSDCTLTTIIEDNHRARRVLEGKRRASIPDYRLRGRLLTLVLPVVSKRRKSSRLSCRWAHQQDQEALGRLLSEQGRGKNFFPVTVEPGFEHFCLAFEGTELVGAMALWDQRAVKQTVVEGYRWSGMEKLWRGLPEPGEVLAEARVGAWVAQDNRVDILEALLAELLAEASRRRLAFLLFGVLEKDPVARLRRRFFHLCYSSLVFQVCFANEPEREVDYLELGCL